ncbi:hypothetical protein C922_05004 [Plasmodium inui San Antonio 1]|uniref:Uncharacterized protein n=1 Tax=Plasmodium inui San Antonio 1 TaxID=1237626 RepID=W7A686_9APIC|nr:hypothetical protein C922_05004 [Plasmodium inui San Antonio 1]EUD64589.1 hypothetical protein C922_05004 [Plasmodium inui San Antonio 1]
MRLAQRLGRCLWGSGPMGGAVSRAVGSIVHNTVRSGNGQNCKNYHNRQNRCYRLTCRGLHSAKMQEDAESQIAEKLRNMQGESVSHAIKKSVKNGFISKRMFNVYNDLVKRHCRGFTFSDVVLTLQAYALSKERNFEVYSILSYRALRLLREEAEASRKKRENGGERNSERGGEEYDENGGGGISYDPERHKNIYRYILASNQLNYSDLELMQLFVEEIKRHFHHYDMKRICKILHALSKLKINDVDLLDAACHHILQNFDMVKCNHINHLISAYTPEKSGGNHDELLLRLVKYICANVKSMDSISVYNTLVQIGPILRRLSRSWYGQTKEEMTAEGGRSNAIRKEAPQSGEDEEQKEYCHLVEDTRGEEPQTDTNGNSSGPSNRQGNIVHRLVPLLFSRVNTCIAFLSLKQLIKLLCAYRELNYFNYNFVYKRLLLFLLSKLRTQHKALAGEYISILEFFTSLPYVDSNMEEIMGIITGNIPKVLSYNYEHLCRLLHCCKQLQICDDAILSRVDYLVIRNKRNFERVSTVEELDIFLNVYNQGSGEWDEILSLLSALVEVKAREDHAERMSNGKTDGEGGLISGGNLAERAPLDTGNPAENVVITYKYSKKHKCFHEYGRQISVERDSSVDVGSSVEGASTGEGETPPLYESQDDEGEVSFASPFPCEGRGVTEG